MKVIAIRVGSPFEFLASLYDVDYRSRGAEFQAVWRSFLPSMSREELSSLRAVLVEVSQIKSRKQLERRWSRAGARFLEPGIDLRKELEAVLDYVNVALAVSSKTK